MPRWGAVGSSPGSASRDLLNPPTPTVWASKVSSEPLPWSLGHGAPLAACSNSCAAFQSGLRAQLRAMTLTATSSLGAKSCKTLESARPWNHSSWVILCGLHGGRRHWTLSAVKTCQLPETKARDAPILGQEQLGRENMIGYDYFRSKSGVCKICAEVASDRKWAPAKLQCPEDAKRPTMHSPSAVGPHEATLLLVRCLAMAHIDVVVRD